MTYLSRSRYHPEHANEFDQKRIAGLMEDVKNAILTATRS
jgi:hypothetical protein